MEDGVKYIDDSDSIKDIVNSHSLALNTQIGEYYSEFSSYEIDCGADIDLRLEIQRLLIMIGQNKKLHDRHNLA